MLLSSSSLLIHRRAKRRMCDGLFRSSTKMKSFSIAKEFPSLKRMLPSPVMVPVQKNFEFQLPQDGKTQNCHKPFQDNTVTIEDFEVRVFGV